MSKDAKSQREFFDRDYTVCLAYSRLKKYVRKYRFRLIVGVLCGVMTAGTLVPFFQIVQPALQHVEAHDAQAGGGKADKACSLDNVGARAPVNDFEKQIKKHSKLPSWYPKVEKLAAKCGIALQNEKGGMGGALILIVCVVVPLVAFLRLGLMFLNHYCLSWVGSHAVADLRMELLEHVQKQNLQFFARVDVGQLLTRITGDPQQIQVILSTILAEVALAPFEILVAFGYIIWFAIANDMLPTLCLIAVGFPVFVFPVHSLGKTVKKWSRRTLERNSLIGSKVHELLTCIRVVKAYHTEEHENVRYRETNRYLLKSTLRALRLGLLVGPTVETVGILLICAFLVWCFATDVKISDVVPMLAPLLIIYKPVKQLSKLQVQVENSLAALSRIYSILDLHMEMPEKADAKSKTTFETALSFDDVSFRYASAERDSVSHVSFDLPRGSTVAVVGSTGSGKTTLSGLLARFYDPDCGSVSIDGRDLRDLRINDLRSLVGVVTQEALLFNDTIEANIKYGTPQATHAQVVEAAKLANAHDFIMSQPEGYNRMAGEKGFALSGGERQRIAIARAILKNPPILILDEATSALDTVTERLVQDALENLMKNRTTFAIAHRLSTVRHANLILVMDSGKVVERGTHEELYAKGGAYRKLCDMQKTD